MKKVAIIGSTGSIGIQTLDILGRYSDMFEVAALSANENIDILEEQIRSFKPAKVAVVNPEKAEMLRKRITPKVEVLSGSESLKALAAMPDVDIVVMAVVGIAGLEATMAAIEAGKYVALANKESLVTGGSLLMDAARKSGGKIIPVDSEHSAIFQCLSGCADINEVNKIILTASGGPFRNYDKESLKQVSVQDALKHPNWKMGKKITIDSATLMNKGLEVIEAVWLFGVNAEQIQVVIHPQSIIHSMVEYIDGSIIAQMSVPDMRLPILYALTYPQRYPGLVQPLNIIEAGELTFSEPDYELFPCLSLAYKAVKIGGTMPTVLNAANEVAVQKFLDGKISFFEIPMLIEKAMRFHKVIENPSIKDILDVDNDTRKLLT